MSAVEIIPDLLRARAASAPDSTAIMVEGERPLSYGGWDRRSNAVARGLAARGVIKGDVVALIFDNARWDDYAVSYMAVHKAGATAVPLAPGITGPDLGLVLAHCQAVAVTCPSDLAPLPAAVSIRAGSPPAWVASPRELEEGQVSDPFQAALTGADLAEIVYTSGTTGRPKGVACSHASIVVHDGSAEDEGPVVTLLHAFPVGTNANQEVLRVTLRRPDRLAMAMTRFDPQRCAVLVEAHRVGRLQLVPSMAQLLVASGAWQDHDLSSVEVVVLSSAPTAPTLLARLAEAFPRARLANAYALTESGTARTLNPDARSSPNSVGRPVGLTELQITDGEGRPVPAGHPGEVLLRREGAPPRGYFRDPDATAAAFTDDWLRTGDVGWLDEAGALYLVDRTKDVIICGGLNVSTLEVENVLYEHPAVVEVAVVGVPHEVLGQDVGAAVVVSQPIEAGELQALARRRLAEHQTPHHITFVERLPRTASGKVRKDEVADILASGAADPDIPYDPPQTPDQKVLAAIWEEVIGVAPIGVHDDFFGRGGHSLAATEMLARIEDALGVHLPLETLFEHPTVASLATAVGTARARLDSNP
ncbi:MAG: AMP-binding protein [Actinomycetota bacterium]|nr:AMP-binding protein [Actinomycetota bacterium]